MEDQFVATGRWQAGRVAEDACNRDWEIRAGCDMRPKRAIALPEQRGTSKPLVSPRQVAGMLGKRRKKNLVGLSEQVGLVFGGEKDLR